LQGILKDAQRLPHPVGLRIVGGELKPPLYKVHTRRPLRELGQGLRQAFIKP
jgi:hypothetical protein